MCVIKHVKAGLFKVPLKEVLVDAVKDQIIHWFKSLI